jgi:ATP/maltotriose-dependent transcriptional regulator MalT
MISEGRLWLDRVLAAIPPESSADGIMALREQAVIAGIQGDLLVARSRIGEARQLVEQVIDPGVGARLDVTEAMVELYSGDLQRSCELSERALPVSADDETRFLSMWLAGWALDISGDSDRALMWLEKARVLADSLGESVWRSKGLVAMGVTLWRRGELERAQQVLKQGLRLSHVGHDMRTGAQCLEVLGWIAAHQHDARRAVLLLGAASRFVRQVEDYWLVVGDQARFHKQCKQNTRDRLGVSEFDAAWREGNGLTFDQAVTVALAEPA